GVGTEFLPHRGTDLTEGRLGTSGLDDEGNEVGLGVPSTLQQPGQGPVHRGGVASTTPIGKDPLLLVLDLVADLEDVELPGDRGGVAVHAHDLLVTLLQ